MIQGLSLLRLKQIMKAHFKQKSATELYQELSDVKRQMNNPRSSRAGLELETADYFCVKR